MVVIYTSAGCASCRKAKQWLKDHDVKFVEKNILTTLLNETEVKYILSRSENGTEDILSKRSKIMQELEIDIDDMKINELVTFIRKNPSVLRRPIIINETNFLVGYDDEEIDAFVPKEVRNRLMNNCAPDCPNYPFCGKTREEIV
ncbi:MAG: transcriptional regulator Spx [Erysipelotrichaceae bacterium]